MAAALPSIFTDAPNWSDTITVTQTYAYTSPDGLTTTTGTAVTTFNRVKLSDVLICPKLMFQGGFPQVYDPDIEDYVSTPLNNQFIVMQSAVGRMPGWLATFGGTDPIPNAFTTTVSSPPNTPGNPPPVVRYSDGGLGLTMTCADMAPGRQVNLGSPIGGSYFYGIIDGLSEGDPAVGAAYDVDLIYPGDAGDDKRPPIPPVYRVTLPDDFAFLDAMTVLYNGVSVDLAYGLTDFLATTLLEVMFQGVFGQLDAFQGATLALRGAQCIDIQLPNYGDTLAAGTLSYTPAVLSDAATLSVGSFTQAIADPFSMSGQSFTFGPDDQGMTVTVQC